MRIGDVDFYTEVEGEGDSVVVLSHSLLTTADAFSPLVDRLRDRFRLLAYDMRGHGRSSAPPSPYAMADLAGDVIGLMDAHGVEKAHFVGVSLGARIGLELALRHPERFNRFVITATGPVVPPELLPLWEKRIATARERGTAGLITHFIESWYGPLREAYPVAQLDALGAMIAGCSLDGFLGCTQALLAHDLTGQLERIAAPILLVAGALDAGASPQTMLKMMQVIPAAQMVVIENAGHQPCLQQPDAYASAVRTFLSGEPLAGV